MTAVVATEAPPTITMASAIEKTCAPWLLVDQSLVPLVDQSLLFLGEFWVELFEFFDEPCELFDESFDEFDESLEPFDEFESEELLEPDFEFC